MRSSTTSVIAALALILIGSGAGLGQAQLTDPAKSEMQLSDQQRAELRSKLERHHKAEIQRPVTIGSALPASVKLAEIPASISSMVPAYARYSFVWVEDDLVIVDPANRVVMAVVPAHTGG